MFLGNMTVFTVVILYFIFLAILGLRGYNKTKTFSDYIIGGRKLGPVVGAMNVGASDMSSWLLMGLPGAFYLYGLNQMWIILGLVIGAYYSWKIIAVRLRKYTELASNSLTISSFLENRFKDNTGILRLATSLIIIFFFAIYISSGFIGSAKLFAELFNIGYHDALVMSIFMIIFYALIGGFLAVSWADLLQGTLMLFALLIVPIGILFANGGLSATIHIIDTFSPAHFNPFYNLTFLGILSSLAWGLGYFGQPHIISKYMAIKNPQDIKIARRICISWMTLSMIGAGLVGLFGFAFFINNPLVEHEMVFINSASLIFSSLIIGLLVSAILAAIMSTINGQILICSGSITEDFYKKYINKTASNMHLIMLTRLWIVLIVILAYILAKNENATILSVVARAWSGLGASIGPIVICALFWQKTTRTGAIFGIISGGVSSVIYSKISYFPYEILPAFITSLIFIFIVSLLTQKEITEEIKNEFKQIS
jgi:sodium/proline symporter